MIEKRLVLPDALGGTHFALTLIDCGGDSAAIVTELADNPGLPVAVTFGAAADVVRSLLPAEAEDPLWIRRWPGHSLAQAVLHSQRACDIHLMVPSGEDWRSRPLPTAAANELLEALARRDTGRVPRRAADLREGNGNGDTHLGKRPSVRQGLGDADNVIPIVRGRRGGGEPNSRERRQGQNECDLQQTAPKPRRPGGALDWQSLGRAGDADPMG